MSENKACTIAPTHHLFPPMQVRIKPDLRKPIKLSAVDNDKTVPNEVDRLLRLSPLRKRLFKIKK